MQTYYDEFINEIVPEEGISIYDQRTLDLQSEIVGERNTRRWDNYAHQLRTAYQIDEAESLRRIYEMDIPDSIVERMAEQIRSTVDRSVLESIMGVQPMPDTTGEVFYMKYMYTGNKREKMDLRLPDEMFELE